MEPTANWAMMHGSHPIKTEPLTQHSNESSPSDMNSMMMIQQQQQQQFYPDQQRHSLFTPHYPEPHVYLHQQQQLRQQIQLQQQQLSHHQQNHQHQQQQNQPQQDSLSFMSTMFKPLTPPGCPNTVLMAAVHQKLHLHQMQQQHQQMQQLQQQHHQQQQLAQQSPPMPQSGMQMSSTPFLQVAHNNMHPNVSPIPLMLTPNETPPIIGDDSNASMAEGQLSTTPAPRVSAPGTAECATPTANMDADSGVEQSSDDLSVVRPCSPKSLMKRAKLAKDFNEGIFKPKLTAKGQVKYHNCKQCDFATATKADLWQHYVCHINPDKILHCGQCPFVTEYKHHLDFHLRNHSGDKPYMCTECQYSCVNKSMLKSHMKSHSDVHPYKCANCSYSTKYCHSMKMHLRTKDHKPAMQLDEDGAVTGGAFIDVYGSRRGPRSAAGASKPKKSRRSKAVKLEQPSAEAMAAEVLADHRQQLLQHPQQTKSELSVEEQAKLNVERIMKLLTELNARNNSLLMMASASDVAMRNESDCSTDAADEDDDEEHCDDDEDEDDNDNMNNDCDDNTEGLNLSVSHMHDESKYPATTSSNTPKLVRRQRKGLAFKLDTAGGSNAIDATGPSLADRLPAEALHDGHMDEMKGPSRSDPLPSASVTVDTKFDTSQSNHGPTSPEHLTPIAHNLPATPPITATLPMPPLSSVYTVACHPCGILFSDPVIHRLHMAYHGFNQPFTCNVCGVVCNDRVMFNMHIATAKH